MVRLLNDFSLMCKNIGGEELCVCDYRVNIYGCPNSDFYVMMTKTLIPICLLVTVMSASFLIYLTKFKKQPFFLNATNGRGLLRPRPLHSYHLLVFAYMLCKYVFVLYGSNERSFRGRKNLNHPMNLNCSRRNSSDHAVK